jgi:hypothetical protein|tara:strand:+ start:460 stop:744 length:285 start_codon:yes stop_codon:yes gene_type:complete
MNWTIEKRKRSTLIFVTDRESTDILIGSGSNKKEYKRSMELAKVIVKALNENEQTGAEQEGWVCKHCGKSTFETDYDYLADVDEHLGCALEKER